LTNAAFFFGMAKVIRIPVMNNRQGKFLFFGYRLSWHTPSLPHLQPGLHCSAGIRRGNTFFITPKGVLSNKKHGIPRLITFAPDATHKNSNMKKSLFQLALLSLLVLASCSKADSGTEHKTPEGPAPSSQKGIGKSKETPEGTAFSLPPGITLVNDTLWGSDALYCGCNDPDSGCRLGTGGLVRLCISFRNNTAEAIPVQLPPGLIFIYTRSSNPDNILTQNGILIKKETFTIDAGAITTFDLMLLCLNSDRKHSGPEDMFVMGPITMNKELNELSQLLSSKNIRPLETGARVQSFVWHITEDGGLTAGDRNEIQAMQ
jgi:hypothetical protein